MVEIKISRDFSDTPGGRGISEGKFSGEEFRETILKDKYNEAESKNEKLCIDFDGCFGFGTSFLEEAFGGLVRKYKKRGVLQRIIIISDEDRTIPININKYVKDAEKMARL